MIEKLLHGAREKLIVARIFLKVFLRKNFQTQPHAFIIRRLHSYDNIRVAISRMTQYYSVWIGT